MGSAEEANVSVKWTVFDGEPALVVYEPGSAWLRWLSGAMGLVGTALGFYGLPKLPTQQWALVLLLCGAALMWLMILVLSLAFGTRRWTLTPKGFWFRPGWFLRRVVFMKNIAKAILEQRPSGTAVVIELHTGETIELPNFPEVEDWARRHLPLEQRLSR